MQVRQGKSKLLQLFAKEMRCEPTDAERRPWSRLRRRQLDGFKFRRQHNIETFIVDFYCTAARLAVELDGGQHTDALSVEYDQQRSARLRSLGIHVLRFSNVDVMRDTDAVVIEIQRVLGEQPPPLPSPGVPREGERAEGEA